MMLDKGDQNVVIAGSDEDGCLDRFQLVVRKSVLRYTAGLGEDRGVLLESHRPIDVRRTSVPLELDRNQLLSFGHFRLSSS
jgi:hypothetical protein